jgi:hypothetical protein
MISCNMTITHQCAGRRPRGRSQEMTTLAVGNVTRLVNKRSHTSFLPIPPHANHTPDLCAHARCAPHLVMISCNMTITHQCAGRRPRGRSQEMTTLAVGNVTRLVKKRSHTSFLPIPPHANHTALIQSALRPAQRRRCADSPQPEGHCPAMASLCLGREGTSIPPIVVDPRRPPPPLHPFFGPFGCLRGT